eukprot:TRINITY_DN8810_c1_g1_i1.p1 TRINITY_DN8810_c1_g1~~TRINITY_DN8810_c1_g1_i1.p1  ORF type:complete len:395 (-),score=19.50 TRINITY_DN8810_c1_g1_i1:404-1588(-)
MAMLASTFGHLTTLRWSFVTPPELLAISCRWCSQLAGASAAWQISSHGRVKTSQGVVGRGSDTDHGYMAVTIAMRKYYVHRLVARAFMGPPPSIDHTHVNHKDGNRKNNHITNLEWVMPSQNTIHSYAQNSERRKTGQFRCKPVLWRPQGEQDWSSSPSMINAAQVTGIGCSSIARCLRLGSKFSHGFEFQLAAPEEPDVLSGEEWRKAYEPNSMACLSRYEVSSLGRVKSSCGKTSWGHKTWSKYHRTSIVMEGLQHMFYIHRLVAATYLGAPPTPRHTQVNHKDGDRGNNRLDNLEYVTPSQNRRHSHLLNSQLRRGGGRPVLGRALSGNDQWVWYASYSEAGRQLGVHPASISKACRQKAELAGKYEFSHAEPFEPALLPGEAWRTLSFHI